MVGAPRGALLESRFREKLKQRCILSMLSILFDWIKGVSVGQKRRGKQYIVKKLSLSEVVTTEIRDG